MEEVLIPKGTLKAHTGFVTAIAVPNSDTTTLVTSSRDKSLILWRLTTPDPFLSSYTFSDSSVSCGYPYRRFTGHSHFVQDVVLSSDSHFALSASWDTELRLWDLTQPPTKSTTRRFIGHKKDVLSVTFSPDNRHILSGSRDRTMKLWNTLGECKFTFSEGFGSHTDWVSSVRFSPSPAQSIVVSGSWDKTVKVWDLNGCKLVKTLNGHTGCVSFVTISPDGSMCASGGKDGVVWLWDLGEGKALYDLKSADGFSGGRADAAGGGLGIVHGLCFCPVKYWLAAATEKCVMIWDLEKETLIQRLGPDSHDATEVTVDPKDETKASRFQQPPPPPPLRKNQGLRCTSVNWSSDGNTLYTGYTDGIIRVWEVAPPKTADYYG